MIKRACVCLVAAAVAATTATVAGQPRPDAWPALGERLRRASTSESAADLRALRGDLLRTLTQPANKDREVLVQYSLAYLASRLVHLQGVPDQERGDLLEDGVERLEAILEINPRDAEAHALAAALYGMQIARTPLKGIHLGGRASGALDDAARLAPDNPRVHLQRGISAFNTPPTFGGDLGDAERSLRRSAELFAREPIDHPWPNWGRFEVHVWLGQVLAKRGDRAAARSEYDKALAIAPGSAWVRQGLLPALERGGKF